jgi:hypothetical protein
LLDPQVTFVSKIKRMTQMYEVESEYSKVFADCMDFLIEKTSMMYVKERLGVEVERSTKSHSKLDGEGIEYSRGRANCVY